MSKICPSKGEARRLVTQGGISVNGQKIDDIAFQVKKADIEGDGLLIKKGKKHYYHLRFG